MAPPWVAHLPKGLPPTRASSKAPLPPGLPPRLSQSLQQSLPPDLQPDVPDVSPNVSLDMPPNVPPDAPPNVPPNMPPDVPHAPPHASKPHGTVSGEQPCVPQRIAAPEVTPPSEPLPRPSLCRPRTSETKEHRRQDDEGPSAQSAQHVWITKMEEAILELDCLEREAAFAVTTSAAPSANVNYELCLPEGVTGGGVFDVMTVDGYSLRLALPKNAKAGATIQFSVPRNSLKAMKQALETSGRGKSSGGGAATTRGAAAAAASPAAAAEAAATATVTMLIPPKEEMTPIATAPKAVSVSGQPVSTGSGLSTSIAHANSRPLAMPQATFEVKVPARSRVGGTLIASTPCGRKVRFALYMPPCITLWAPARSDPLALPFPHKSSKLLPAHAMTPLRRREEKRSNSCRCMHGTN